jgi:hypothetical protein
MSAAATATPKVAHTHMVTHLAALAMLLDDDHLETLILTLCRDNDIIPMLFRKETFCPEGKGEFDGATLFASLNEALWEKGRGLLAEMSATGPLETAAGGAAAGGCGA